MSLTDRLIQYGIRTLLVLIMVISLAACKDRSPENSNSGTIEIDSSLYWKYNGRKTLLLGGFNHGHNPFIDGSTLDEKEVDDMEEIIRQIQEMVDIGGNTLRCVLDPGNATEQGIESYRFDSSGRYDLNRPGGPFWERLTTFVAEAEKRSVIVEIEIWDRFDWRGESWESNPFHPKKNNNYTTETAGLGIDYTRSEIYSRHPFSKGVPGHPDYDTASADRKAQYDTVRKYQEIFVEKVLSSTIGFGNVIYNMNNETGEDPAWGEYWINHLKRQAAEKGKHILCTNMQDDAFKAQDSEYLVHQLNHPEIYDYLDVSQVNSRHRDEIHWEKISWIADQARERGFLLHMTKVYGSDAALDGDPWQGWKPGDSDNAIEEWWRNLIAGVAGVRFHRPPSGLGLTDRSKACIQATRKVESKVKFWDVSHRMDLLSGRVDDEAYLAADPGEQYILYFTHQGGGSVHLDLSAYRRARFDLLWINVDTGMWGDTERISGGHFVAISRPDDTAHWVAVICKRK